ncbi:alpha/beta fold hydrolase [Thalassobius sp. I31.1]|uniref:alpha/beta hydrolase family protein n=1 Tax=Thalassobius sp. I31.1 TaxID=2109912 RepID=UPI000D1B72D1|nr:alpha/beta fold hydrolase [Thalassobius sp. I31.1]
MKRPFIYLAATIATVSIVAAIWLVRGLSDFDLSEHTQRDITFAVDDAVLSGTLILPKDVTAPPIAIIVHGDGAQDRFSNAGYLPLFSALADAGIGVFSWDKAGVGASTGNWLNQTMDDRADEVLAALQAVSALDGIDANRVGFLGFSQAGWVLPRVASRIVPSFTIIVGGAVSWRGQGTYYKRVALTSQGVPADVIEERLADRRRINDVIFGTSADPSMVPEMETERFEFVAGAYWEDSTQSIPNMNGPVLAIWGEDDLNVDARSDSEIFREQLMPLSEIRQVILVPDATHGLLRSDLFSYQLTSEWPWYLQYIFMGMGQDAFVDGTLDEITSWILTATKE